MIEDSGTRFLDKDRLLIEDISKQRCRRENGSTRLLFFCLLGMVPAVLCGSFLTIFVLSKQSPDDDTNTVDTLAELEVPKASASDIMRPPSADIEEHTLLNTAAPVAEPPAIERHYLPTRSTRSDVCTTPLCNYVAQWLRSIIDESKEPCKDFYGYVCGRFRGLSQLNQTTDLAAWMISLNLDFTNETRLATVNPVEMIVRCSLDLGFPALFSIVIHTSWFTSEKRAMKIEYSPEEYMWLETRFRIKEGDNWNHYALLLRWYGIDPPRDYDLAVKIFGYEKELRDISKTTTVRNGRYLQLAIRRLGTYTKPYVTAEQWGEFFSKYTNNTYRGMDSIFAQTHVVNMLAKLLKSKSVGEKGLRHLVAWSVYTQLVDYTVPRLLVRHNKASDVCYEHVAKAMKLAVVNPYLQSIVKPFMLEQVRTMLANIRNVFRDAFNFSTWVKGEVRESALRKLDRMKSYVGSPGPFPDVPKDAFFPTWINAVSLSSHYIWTDQTTWLYDEAAVNALYQVLYNAIVIPTAIIQRPFHFYEGPLALSYGGLGALTLRARQQELDDTLDSENLADFVGARIAYDAFTSLPHHERILKLGGLNISAERLFFISHCVKSCAEYGQLTSQYAPFRSRCIVPLMNMPEFSNAFGCVAGQPMNPKKKCNFWS
ncbi:hypothetical protein HPB49_010629 [Dermacentor silvarum]|uniref:Uncharacterized protein n=1 Tax=Dermacentor silvarum TaxID=543639 RepID=A0ACB8D4N4_DERSI|nr:hypothetical protein HPB49_010629 [Dermacentor silvarum]